MARRKTKTASLGVSLAMTFAALVAASGPATASEDIVTTPADIQVEIGSSSVTVSWDPSTSTAGDISIYFVKLGSRWLWTDETTMTLFLNQSSTYTLSVQAQDEAYNRSDWSEPTEFRTPDQAPVTTPLNVRTSDSAGSLMVEWEMSESDAGIVDYVVTLRGGSIGSVSKNTTGTTASFDLPPGGEFEATVKARDAAYRWSDTSDPVTASVAPAEDWELPSAPSNFRAVPEGNAIVFQWGAADGGAPPIDYEIFLDGQQIEETRATELLSPYFAECEPGQSPMTFVVRATSYGFTSPPSNAIELCFA